MFAFWYLFVFPVCVSCLVAFLPFLPLTFHTRFLTGDPLRTNCGRPLNPPSLDGMFISHRVGTKLFPPHFCDDG